MVNRISGDNAKAERLHPPGGRAAQDLEEDDCILGLSLEEPEALVRS